ncbi:MAG: DNA-binding protein WhiA [Clostridia bacterium]|nr:DNA-binding protein WhiA [Clostridia bacterium]
MSLTDSIVEEFYLLEPNKTCCRKARLCGLLYSCRCTVAKSVISASLAREADAKRAVGIIEQIFPSSHVTQIKNCRHGGHKRYEFEFYSKTLATSFIDIDNGELESVSSAFGFRCKDCEGHFLRGAFESCATLSNPKSGYHLEFTFVGEKRAELFLDILSSNVAAPGKINRNGKIGLYYKSNVKISDALYFFGATKSSFEMTNMSIERDIRNNENRATNCVTRNIMRSVDAASRHVEAIRYLMSIEKFEILTNELADTARLRLENDTATLSELAAMHMPPITKSGLNGRLARILAIAEEQKKAREDNK